MKEFLERSPKILDALFALEVDPEIGSPCACERNDALRMLRCRDCALASSMCVECILEKHIHLPFHRLEKWTGSYFRRWSLHKSGYSLALGHGGTHCPCASDVNTKLIIVHVNGLHRIRIIYCRCYGAPSEPYQLLAASLYPATWDTPQTAFTIPLLKHYHLDSLQSRKPAYDYWALLRRLTDNTRAKGLPVRYEELLRVSREWRCLMRLKRSGQAIGISKFLPNGSTSVAVLCPACPEPGFNMPEGWELQVGPETLHKHTLFLGIDGNFRAVVIQKPHDVNDTPLLDGRGYFTPVEANGALEEHSVDDPNEHKSTCSNLRSMTSFTKRRGIAVTGIIAVFDVRHSTYRPNSIVDMTVGEKFCLNDFALAGALGDAPNILLPRFLLCDKGCQYSVRLHQRFKDTYPTLAPVVETMTVLINKMHLQGHQDDCRFRFAPHYTPGTGQTDGEGVERPWPHSNETAKITKDQNPGHRKDTFDDTNGDWNYRKLIAMATSIIEKLRDAVNKRTAAERNFQAVTSAVSVELVAEWETLPTKPWFEDGVWRSIYRADANKVPKQRELLAALIAQDEAESRALGNLDFDESQSSTAFLDLALSLEIKQARLVEFKASLPGSPSKEQLRQLRARRADLRDDLTSFYALQAVHMPALGSAPTSDDFGFSIDEDFGRPEAEPLSLPSGWPDPEDRKRHGFTALAEREYSLRKAAADAAIANMKISVQASNQALAFKHGNIRGYGPTTRAEEMVQSNFKKVHKHADTYRRHYDAMVSLGIPKADSSRYQPLTAQDLKNLYVSATQPAKLGESQLPQAWFWGGDRDAPGSKNQKSLDKLSAEELRVRWFRTRAHRDRCREEVEILQAELARTLASFKRWRSIWAELAAAEQDSADRSPRSTAGRRSYAHKQSAIYAQRVTQVEDCVREAEQLLAGVVSGRKRNVAGEAKNDEDGGPDLEWTYFS